MASLPSELQDPPLPHSQPLHDPASLEVFYFLPASSTASVAADDDDDDDETR